MTDSLNTPVEAFSAEIALYLCECECGMLCSNGWLGKAVCGGDLLHNVDLTSVQAIRERGRGYILLFLYSHYNDAFLTC